MSKTLNLELFKPWFIFYFKWNKHLVVKDYETEVLVIDLEYNLTDLYDACKYWIDPQFQDNFDDIIYLLSYVDILEDILHSDRLRWEEVDFSLLIEQECE